jgi:hypothetical protein
MRAYSTPTVNLTHSPEAVKEIAQKKFAVA